MISELTDREILDFLMTSDFQENLSPEELRFLLLKFRNYFRVISSKNDMISSELDIQIKNVKMIEQASNQTIERLSSDNSKLIDEIDKIKSKKLSLKERIFGKIIT